MERLDPVIVGVGQVSRRPEGADDLNDPLALMIEAARAALADAEGADLLRRIESVRVVESLGWRSANPAASVAAGLEIEARDHVVTATGGNGPQALLHETCTSIQRGELDAAVLVGAEAFYSSRLARKLGVAKDDRPRPGPEENTDPARVLGDPRSGIHPAESAIGIGLPTQVYPLFSNAVRVRGGFTPLEHRLRYAALWSRFSEIAAANPFAWNQIAYRPDEIIEPGPDNRMIAYSYTKRCCANIQVDQGAALLVMSAHAADEAGIPRDRWVFPWAGAAANDHWFVSEREDLHSSPAIAECWSAIREVTGLGADDLDLVDLYSCFPAATVITAAELGLPVSDPDRPLTLTGGLPFAGGPGNNYCMHSLATAIERIREEPDAKALVTGVGWFMTKHALTVLSGRPRSDGFLEAYSPQSRIDGQPKRTVLAGRHADLALETFTVLYNRDGSPEKGVVAGLSPAGARGWLTTNDGPIMEALMSGEEVDLSDRAFA